MKKAIFVFTVFVMLFGIKIIEKKRSMELMVYEMYLDNFEEYLTFDENLDIIYDKSLIKKFFEDKGYNIKFKDENLNFVLSFEMIVCYEKEYSFYLEKNNEIK